MRSGRVSYCEMCKRVVPRSTLVYRPVKYAMPKGMHNLLAQSKYTDGTGWVISGLSTGSYDGPNSLGVHPDPRWTLFDADYNPTIRMGCPTFKGMVILFHQPPVLFDPAVESYSFAVMVGPWEQEHFPLLTVEVGLWHADDWTQLRNHWHRPISCITQVWHRWETSAPLGSVERGGIPVTVTDETFAGKSWSPYLKVTPSGPDVRWWFEEAQLERNVLRPGPHLATDGVAIETFGGDLTGYAAVCPKCVEDIPDFVDWHPIEIPPPRYDGLDDILPEE